MNIDFITKSDFIEFKSEIVEEIKKLLQTPTITDAEWLKSSDVMAILRCSPGTLQNLRINGSLPFTKMGGTIYYARKDVLTVLESNKRNAS